MRTSVIAAATLTLACSAMATEGGFKLKEAPGLTQVQANCVACHSLDYVQLNSRFLDRKGWEAEVNKMVKVYGAPVKDADVPAIVDYLTREYGRQ